ncbi:MAG: hypothetical protein ABI577_15435 [bacterium]
MSEEIPIGRLVSIIVAVLAATLLLSLAGLVLLGIMGASPDSATTLTHVIETVLGVFVGIAAGTLANRE